MLKKTVLLLILVAIVTGGVFADEVWNNSFNFKSGPTPQSGALFVDLSYTFAYMILGGFGVGLGWEGRINDTSTYLISGNIGAYDYNSGSLFGLGYKYSGFDFGLEGNYRYYIFKSAIDKLFVNAGLGFGVITWTYSGYYNDKYSWAALYIPLYAGYKVIIGPGFVAELHLGYRVGIRVSEPDNYYSSLRSPSFGGGIFGIALGWAF